MFRYFFFLLLVCSFAYGELKFNITLVPSIELSPVDTFTKKDNSKNVLQGIASYGDKWFVSQAVGKKRVLFNLLNKEGVSIANRQLKYASHGQDISFEEINASAFYLYTVGKHNKGFAKFLVKHSSKDKKLNIKLVKELKSNKHNSMVTLSEDKNYLLSYNKGVITIYDKNSLKKISTLSILKEQQKIWFQGFIMYHDYIFTLSGKNGIKDMKMLVVYSKKGECILSLNIKPTNVNKGLADKKGKWELEGLTLKNKILYTTINSKIDGKKSKKLLELLKIEE